MEEHGTDKHSTLASSSDGEPDDVEHERDTNGEDGGEQSEPGSHSGLDNGSQETSVRDESDIRPPLEDTAGTFDMELGVKGILMRMERKIDAQSAKLSSLEAEMLEIKSAYKLEMEANQKYRQQSANELKAIQSNQEVEQVR